MIFTKKCISLWTLCCYKLFNSFLFLSTSLNPSQISISVLACSCYILSYNASVWSVSAEVLRTWLYLQVTGILTLECDITPHIFKKSLSVLVSSHHSVALMSVQRLVYNILWLGLFENKESWRFKGPREDGLGQSGTPLKEDKSNRDSYVYNTSLGCWETAKLLWQLHSMWVKKIIFIVLFT